MRHAKIILLLALAAVSVPALGEHGDGARHDSITAYQAYTARALRTHFPNVRLLNQNKRALRFYDDLIRGNVVMIQFMFANCEELCPMTTPNLAKVQKELQRRTARNVKMISITVDPVHDTPAVLKEYANRFHVQPGWEFLTGKKSDIDRIRRELGVYDSDEKKIEHMNVLTIGREATGQWLAIEALAKPNDIADTVLRLVPKTSKGDGRAVPRPASLIPERHASGVVPVRGRNE